MFWLAAGLFLIPVLMCSVLFAAAVVTRPQLLARDLPFISVSVTGAVYGENAAQREAGREAVGPVVGATVSCGGADAMTDAQGRYSLNLLGGRGYACVVTGPQYATMTASIHPQLSGSYTLDFGAPASTAIGDGSCASIPSGQRCGALALQPGSISGVVVDNANSQPVNSASITCWDDSAAARVALKNPARYTAVADAHGQYIIKNAPVGPYACVAAQSETPQRVVARPGAISTLDFSVCLNRCRDVSYHGGDVMHTFTGYVIFWVPRGARLDPTGSDTRFRSLVAQYLKDVGGTAFYGLMSQYWDASGPVRNVVRLGGTYVDTHSYPHAGTTADPLNDTDISTEIERVSESQRWQVNPGVGFALITAYGVQTCATYQGHRSCSFPQGSDPGFCAYHSSTSYSRSGSTASYLPYMLVTDGPGCDYLPTFGVAPAPYGDPLADAVINSLSHEQFEMVTDPAGDGWYDDSDYSEIGDKCETSFGFPGSDGANVRLAHGHGYALQREWSASANSCSYG